MSDGRDSQPELTLREKQSLFCKCEAKWIDFATMRGYELTHGEGYITTPRKTRDGKVVDDGVHMRASLHYEQLAGDYNLFVKGVYITSTEHPAWQELGHYWESLDPLCRWGGRFADGNHLSITHEGRA